MRDILVRIVGSPAALVGLSAFLATFVASVMADEQNDRLRQGTFGAIAGGAVGGFAAIIQKDGTLLLVGVFGSASGAIVGWIVYLGLSVLASRKWARTLIEYQVTGLKGVRAHRSGGPALAAEGAYLVEPEIPWHGTAGNPGDSRELSVARLPQVGHGNAS